MTGSKLNRYWIAFIVNPLVNLLDFLQLNSLLESLSSITRIFVEHIVDRST